MFGLPAMIVMLYFMFHKPAGAHPAPVGNETMEGNLSTTPTPKMSTSGHYQIMVIPGLSVENLLLFLLSTPVQVCAQSTMGNSPFNYIYIKYIKFSLHTTKKNLMFCRTNADIIK